MFIAAYGAYQKIQLFGCLIFLNLLNQKTPAFDYMNLEVKKQVLRLQYPDTGLNPCQSLDLFHSALSGFCLAYLSTSHY